MRDSEFSRLLSRTARAASKHFDLTVQVNDECQLRYGCSYSDIDADGIIETLDITGADSFTNIEFDKEMENAGRSRIT